MNFSGDHIRCVHSARHDPPREVFRDLSIAISGRESVGILGREGSGKTTLLNLLGGLVPPSAGSVRIDGADPHASGGVIRRRIGFTFQFPEEQFLRQTVAEEFADLLRLHGAPSGEAESRMEESLALMGLEPRGTPPRSPYSLSLGESRRLALALLLASRPEAALLDEPTAGLDASGIACTLQALRGLSRAGATLIVATHDVDFLAEIAGRVLILAEGGIAADGEAVEILTDGALLAGHGYGLPEAVRVASALREKGKLDGRRVLRLADLPSFPGSFPSGDTRQGCGGEDGDR